MGVDKAGQHHMAFEVTEDGYRCTVKAPDRIYDEDERSRAPSVFSVLRAVTGHLASDEDDQLGLYGAFGYDLVFQFEPIELSLPRPADQRDLVLFLADVEQRTIPRQMWSGIREQISPTILAVATILVLISIALLTTVELLRRRSERLRGVRPT